MEMSTSQDSSQYYCISQTQGSPSTVRYDFFNEYQTDGNQRTPKRPKRFQKDSPILQRSERSRRKQEPTQCKALEDLIAEVESINNRSQKKKEEATLNLELSVSSTTVKDESSLDVDQFSDCSQNTMDSFIAIADTLEHSSSGNLTLDKVSITPKSQQSPKPSMSGISASREPKTPTRYLKSPLLNSVKSSQQNSSLRRVTSTTTSDEELELCNHKSPELCNRRIDRLSSRSSSGLSGLAARSPKTLKSPRSLKSPKPLKTDGCKTPTSSRASFSESPIVSKSSRSRPSMAMGPKRLSDQLTMDQYFSGVKSPKIQKLQSKNENVDWLDIIFLDGSFDKIVDEARKKMKESPSK